MPDNTQQGNKGGQQGDKMGQSGQQGQGGKQGMGGQHGQGGQQGRPLEAPVGIVTSAVLIGTIEGPS